MKKRRFYVKTDGNDDKAFLEAIAQAGALAKQDPAIKKAVILVHTKSNTAWFDRLFGAAFTKQLSTGAYISGFPFQLKLETLKTFNGVADVVITCALDDRELFDLDDSHYVGVIIVVPHQLALVDGWLKRWNPIDVRSGETSPESVQLPCVVREALERLTNTINLSTGIAHPSDNARAKTFIRALHKYSSPLESAPVASYLVTKLNWSASDANDIVKLIETLNDGSYFQGGERTGLREHFKRWKAACD